MRSSWLAAAAMGLAVCSAPALAVKVQSDFEAGGTYYGGTEGWFGYGMGSSGAATPTGATSTMFGGLPVNQYYGQMTAQGWTTPDVTVADWNAHATLEFDILVDSAWYPNGITTATVEFQANSINKYGYGTFNSALKDTVQHVVVNYDSLKPFDTTDGWNLSIETHPGYAWEWDSANSSVVPFAAHVYIDNVTWTPEPASIGLLAVGSLLALRRR